jgi:hypothetical protein
MSDNVCPVCDDGQENAIRVASDRSGPGTRTGPERRIVGRLGGRDLPMWFYIPAIIVIALLAFWFFRSNVFRNRLRAHDPVHDGRPSRDPVGEVGLYDGGGGGGGGG